MSSHSSSSPAPAICLRSSSVPCSPAGYAQDPQEHYSLLLDVEVCGTWETQPLSAADYDEQYLLKAYNLNLTKSLGKGSETAMCTAPIARANLFVQRILDLAKISAQIACELQDESIEDYDYTRVYKDLTASFDQVAALLPSPAPLQTAETLDNLVPQLVPLLRKPLLESLQPRLLKDLRQPIADELSIPLQDAIQAMISAQQDTLCAQLHRPLLDNLETALDDMLSRKLVNIRADLEGVLGFSLIGPLTTSVYERLQA
ncbi:hypothetical protein C2E23DRAFT_883102 [Lenzites betulinus]|nr:hypothetical protein C2E23DRAFT_883102 [Lenzites betulinus]